MIWIWAALIVIFVVGEIVMTNLICIWFAGGAFVAMLLDLFHVSMLTQIIVFLIVSLVLLLATRPLAKKKLDYKKQKTNLDAIVGKEAIVTEEIRDQEAGAVKIEGKVWTAKSESGDILTPGDTVIIDEIRGVTLFVTRKGN